MASAGTVQRPMSTGLELREARTLCPSRPPLTFVHQDRQVVSTSDVTDLWLDSSEEVGPRVTP
jgi:hypothetical protein